VTVENTVNSKQGKIFPLKDIEELHEFTSGRGISLHLDGARLFNAHIATGIPLSDFAANVDTISVCFSKGLGAPLGSMLLGPRDIIERARRLRIWHGSGFHQIGICAEAAYYGLRRQLDRLHEDHRLTRMLAERLAELPLFGICLSGVQTNMIYLNLPGGLPMVNELIVRAAGQGVLIGSFPPNMARLVVCRNVEEPDIVNAADILLRIGEEMTARGCNTESGELALPLPNSSNSNVVREDSNIAHSSATTIPQES
jgi:threonine aldolase